MKLVKLLPISALCFLVVKASWCQELAVENVCFFQRPDTMVVIVYDLVGKPSRYEVKLSLYRPDIYDTLALMGPSVIGAVGKNIRPGKDKKIGWYLPTDFPRGLAGDDFVFIIDVYEQKNWLRWPWVVAGLTALGGGVAYLLKPSNSSDSPVPVVDLPEPPEFP